MKRRNNYIVEDEVFDLEHDDLQAITLRYERLAYTPELRDTDRAAAAAGARVAAGSFLVAAALVAALFLHDDAIRMLNAYFVASSSNPEIASAFAVIANPNDDGANGAQTLVAALPHALAIVCALISIILAAAWLRRRAARRRLADLRRRHSAESAAASTSR